MWDKLKSIAEILEGFGEKRDYIHPRTGHKGPEFHVTDEDLFIDIVLENNGEYTKNNREDEDYPLQLNTIKDGIKVFCIGTEEKIKYIENKIW